MDLIRSISWISASQLRSVRDDDSYVDRLSHRYTVALLVLFAIVVTTKQYAGDQIDCWVPAQFKASYEKYADSYCWIAGSWYIPMNKEFPLSDPEKKQNRIKYYQWVPFLLLFQALLFYIPRIIWRCLSIRSGLNLVNLIDASLKYESVDKYSDRSKIMSYIVTNIERYICTRRYPFGFTLIKKHGKTFKLYQTKRNSSVSSMNQSLWSKFKLYLSVICFWSGKSLGNYLIVLYVFVKTLWLTNIISQLFLLNRFIGNDYYAFGLEVIEMLLSGNEWTELRHFPRVTYCDFRIREIGNSHDWTVQCVLRINLFNEVIYIFMWFWLCFLSICILFDYIHWILNFIVSKNKLKFIQKHVDIYSFYVTKHDDTNQTYTEERKKILINANTEAVEYIDLEKEKNLLKEFTYKHLSDDCIFALRVLESSSSDLIVTEIVNELWRNFRLIKEDAKQHEPANSLQIPRVIVDKYSTSDGDDVESVRENLISEIKPKSVLRVKNQQRSSRP
jgi:innexin